MNCSRVKALLPLYTEGDLCYDPRRERAVAVHLQTCYDCARHAAEFSRSQNLLRAAALTPSFDAAFFNEIRSTVRAQIEARESVGLSFAAGIFRRKLALTTTFVLLLVAGSVVIYTRLDRTPNSSQASDSAIVRQDPLRHNALSETPPAARHDADEQWPPSRAATLRSDAHSSHRTGARRAAFIHERRMQPSSRVTSKTEIEMNLAALPTRTEEANEANEPATNDIADDDLAQATAGDASESNDQTLRIEFQTSDPTIRIIWLAPRTNELPPATPMN